MTASFNVGDLVVVKNDVCHFTGEVVSVFKSKSNQVRFVVENKEGLFYIAHAMEMNIYDEGNYKS